MTWTNFKQYLQTKILQTNEESEDTYLLHPETKSKYSPTKEQELLTALTSLIQSIDNLPSYSSLSENQEYHPLPDLDLYTEQDQLITWTHLFPKRENTHFGKKQEIEAEISSSTWTILSKIFTDWTQTITRSQRLKSALGEDQIMGKFLLEAAISLNYDLIKRKGYDLQLKAWLAEYQLLEKSEQEQLQKQKEMVSKLLEALEEEEKTRQQTNWYQNIPWKKIIWYGGGGLLIILVLGWLWKKLQE